MSSKKVNPDVNKARLSALKHLGILTSIPLRGSLSDKQKRQIRTEFKKFHAVANAAPGEFEAKSTHNLSESDKRNLKNSGYLMTDKKVFIPKQGYYKTAIQKEWIRNPETGMQEKVLKVIRTDKLGRKSEAELNGEPLEKMEWRDRLMREHRLGKFKDGDYIGVKVFDNGRFEREVVMSVDVLMRYLENMKWHDKDTQRMYDNLHLVKISVKDFRDLATDDNRKDKDHSKYLRGKNRKATKTLSITNPEKLKQIQKKKEIRKGTPTKLTGRHKK